MSGINTTFQQVSLEEGLIIGLGQAEDKEAIKGFCGVKFENILIVQRFWIFNRTIWTIDKTNKKL